MINLEQVKLLETKVAKAIICIERLTKENARLADKEAALSEKEFEQQLELEAGQKRINELEGLIMRLKEDQSRIEDSILATLDRLNQFEEAIEKSLVDKPADKAADKPADKAADKASDKAFDKAPAVKKAAPADEKIFFEIPETDDDILDPLILDEESAEQPAQSEELDIF